MEENKNNINIKNNSDSNLNVTDSNLDFSMVDVSDDNLGNKMSNKPNHSDSVYNAGNINNNANNANIKRPDAKENEELSRRNNGLNDNKKNPNNDKLKNDAKNSNNDLNNNKKNDLNNNKDNNLNKNLQNRKNDALNKLKDKAPENLKNNAKEALNQGKELAKDLGSKAAGKAITAATGGAIPPKLGEKLSKKALNKADKKIQKKGNQAIQKAKDKTKNKVNQFKEKHKDAIDKAGKASKTAVKAVKLYIKRQKIKKVVIASLIAIGLILIIGVGSMLISNFTLLLPGVRGNLENDEEDEIISSYSKRDQKIINKLQKVVNEYPEGDPAFVMAVVSYPHYSLIRVEDTGSDEETEEDNKDYSNYSNPYESDEDDEVDDTSDDEEEEDDMYLNLFSERKYRSEFKSLMKEYQGKGKDSFEEYLVNEYFEDDKDYKKLIKKTIKESEEEINKNTYKKDLIEKIRKAAELYENYFKAPENCATGVQVVGSINISNSELLKSGDDNILVDVKEESCTTSKKIETNCSSMFTSPISLEEYVKGVVWTEMSVNSSVNIETVKAQMLAAKSYVLTRYESMGWSLSTSSDGRYVVPIRPNTNDQDYCDYKVGCHNKRSGNSHGAAGDAEQKILNEAWQAVKNIYIVDSNGKPKGSYCANRVNSSYADCSWCKKGTCLSQTELTKYKTQSFEDIIMDQYYSYALATVEDGNATGKIASTGFCTGSSANKNAKRSEIVDLVTTSTGNIPYVENSLAREKEYESNNFGVVKNETTGEEVKTGLGIVGYINFIYWNKIDQNFGNTNDINQILANGFEIEFSNILAGDIGYSEDKTLVGIYMGDNKWAFEDKTTGYNVIKPSTAFTKYLRLNYFKSDSYDYTVRESTPTASEWGGSNMLFKPSTPSLMGECPWYAKNRALEIVAELYNKGNLTEAQYKKYSKRIRNTSGNGIQFVPGGAADNGYKGSTNIADIKAGAFIGMSSQYTSAGRTYGHVAVVEYVSDNLIIVTDGWRLKTPNTYCKSYNDFSCVVFKERKFSSYQEFYKTYHNSSGFMFKGYLYFLED